MSRLSGQCSLAIAAFLIAACQATNETPAPVVWSDRVPTAGPSAIAAQPVVARSPGSVTILPISPTGAAIGVPYGYEMPHCGIQSPIDVDGSFWDPVDPPSDRVAFDGVDGSFELVTAREATFRASSGGVLHLTRHVGARSFGPCF